MYLFMLKLLIISIFLSACSTGAIGDNVCQSHLIQKRNLFTKYFNINLSTKVVDNDDTYTYQFGICTSADPNNILGQPKAGLLQINGKTKSVINIGQFANAQVIDNGGNWFMMTYSGGDNYTTHCGKSPRKAIIMFICNPDVPEPLFSMLSEHNDNKDGKGDCFYLFEVEHYLVCRGADLVVQKLSTGTILLIVVLTLVLVYLIVGLLIQRFVRNARGIDQIPNLSFWRACGNRMADGCDFVCRSEPRTPVNRYHSVTDNDHHVTHLEDDDNLLPP